MKLNLGCGKSRKEGFLGVDICKLDTVDIVQDLNSEGWAIESGTVEEVFCSHTLEHIKNFDVFFNELYRVMKLGSKAYFVTPYYNSVRAWQDYTHERAVSENSYAYLSRQWRLANHLDHYSLNCDFDMVFSYDLEQEWVGRSDIAKAFAIKHYTNVVRDLHAVLTKC